MKKRNWQIRRVNKKKSDYGGSIEKKKTRKYINTIKPTTKNVRKKKKEGRERGWVRIGKKIMNGERTERREKGIRMSRDKKGKEKDDKLIETKRINGKKKLKKVQ